MTTSVNTISLQSHHGRSAVSKGIAFGFDEVTYSAASTKEQLLVLPHMLLTTGTYICPLWCFEVCTTLKCGKNDCVMACSASGSLKLCPKAGHVSHRPAAE